MEREHALDVTFDLGGLTTTPRAEWLYVVSQAVGSRRDRAHDCTPERVGWRLEDFIKCDTARKAGLVREEIIAIRLYTGPMSCKYNATLSTRDKTSFTATIHALNSAIVKLSTMQHATTVYRVMTISAPPDQFFEPNSLGSCVGFEPSFMSTTANLSFAMRLLSERQWLRQAHHSKAGSGARIGAGVASAKCAASRYTGSTGADSHDSVVLIRIRVIPTDLAADVSFASQSPLEHEVIFAALSSFDVVSRYREPALSAIVADLRPRHAAFTGTIDQIIGKMKYSHIALVDLMIDELRAAGAPEPSLLPLNSLRTERLDQEPKDFNAVDSFVNYTKTAMRAQTSVLRDLSKEGSWQVEKAKAKELSQRMLDIVALQVRFGEHDAAIDMTRLALKRSSLPTALSLQVEEQERHAVALMSNQSAAVVKPSEIRRMFPESQHSILEGAAFFLDLGMVPPWPPLVAALLAKMSAASHMVFGELVRERLARKTSTDRSSNAVVFDESCDQWQHGILSEKGDSVRFAGVQMPLQEGLRVLWPTDAGAGALLNEAAGRGDVALVNTLLEARVDLQFSDERANSTLHRAVTGGHANVCQLLLESKAEPLSINADALSPWDLAIRGAHHSVRRILSPTSSDIDAEGGPTPLATVSDHMHEREYARRLLLASIHGNASLLAMTLDEAASTKLRIVDTPNLLHVTPLMFASRAKGGYEAVRVLIKYDATVTLKTRRGCSALTMAAEAGHADSMQLLLAANASADVNMIDARGYSAIHMAVENGHHDVAQLLLDHGADVNIPRKNHWTCLLSAAFHGSTSVLQMLVEHAADVNATFVAGHADGMSFADSFAAIHLAAYSGFNSSVRELVRLGADVDLVMGNGWSPLMVAAAQGHTDIVASLIDKRASVDYQGSVQRVTALMAAAWNPQGTACMGVLLQARAKINLQDAHGLDALMLSARLRHAPAVQQLLLQRADPKVARAGGTTALMDAAAAGSEDIVSLLISGGAELAATDEEGTSPLMHAAKHGHELAMLPLLQAGANVQRVDQTSRPAIAYAKTKQVARRLVEAGAAIDHLSDKLCVELGLPLPGLFVPVAADIAKGGKGTSVKPVVSRTSVSPPRRSDAPKAERVDETIRLRAGEAMGQLLREALSPLKLEPTVADTAPLLQLYMQNSSARQIGASIIIQRNFREMRLRRQKELKARFYLPRSIAKKT